MINLFFKRLIFPLSEWQYYILILRFHLINFKYSETATKIWKKSLLTKLHTYVKTKRNIFFSNFVTFSQWMSNSFWFGFNVQFGSSLKIVFHFGYFRGFRLLYKLTNFQNQTKLYNLTLAYIYCASIAQVTWPQMIQFWDVDLSAIHQKWPLNLRSLGGRPLDFNLNGIFEISGFHWSKWAIDCLIWKTFIFQIFNIQPLRGCYKLEKGNFSK